MKHILFLFYFCEISYGKHGEYAGWKSYYVGPLTEKQVKQFGTLLHNHYVDVLSHPSVGQEGLVLVKPPSKNKFIQALKQIDVAYKVHSEDVETAEMETFLSRKENYEIFDRANVPPIPCDVNLTQSELNKEDELFARRKADSFLRNGKNIPYDAYHQYDVIEKYILDIAAEHPDIVTLVTPNKTFEGRQIRYLKISTSNFKNSSIPVIFIDAGIHAREWISPPTVTWAIQKLVEEDRSSELLTNYDWILLPVVNPDGYEFTHTTIRFWRKTMSFNKNFLSFLCPGADGNRNFDILWGTVGTDPSPCSSVYPGFQAFSEIETRVVRNIILEHLPRMALYITMHSYGSMILHPWCHDGSDPETIKDLRDVAVAMAEVFDRNALPNFPRYKVGNSLNIIGYAASGSSVDYAFHVGVPLAYTIELPGLMGGRVGFHLDPIYIQNVCNETWEGIVAGVKMAGDMFRFRNKSNQRRPKVPLN